MKNKYSGEHLFARILNQHYVYSHSEINIFPKNAQENLRKYNPSL